MVDLIAGNQGDLALALQSAAGAPAALSQFRTYLSGGGFAPMKDISVIEETTAARIRSDTYVTQIRGEGAPAFFVRPNLIGLLLYAVLGAKSVTGAADPYTHTFVPASILPWLTAWRRVGPLSAGLYDRFEDVKCTQLVLASGAGGLLQATATLVGLRPRNQAAAEVTVVAEIGAPFEHADLKGAFLIEGTHVASIEQATLTINNNGALQQGADVIGYAVSEQALEITLACTQAVENFDLWRRFLYATATPADGDDVSRSVLELGGTPSIDIKYTLPGGAPERSLQFTAPRVQANPDSIEPNVDGSPLKYGVTYRMLKPTVGSALSAILMNSVSAYAAA